MTVANAANRSKKTVGDPIAEFESLLPLWQRCRAACSGERHVKAFDSFVTAAQMKSLLIPFSPTMSAPQFEFYKAEAEFPGITAQFSKMLVGGLLRKQPVLKLPAGLPEEAMNWIMNEFGQDGSALTAFLDEALMEELQTSRPWVYLDHPAIPEDASPELIDSAKPYPVLWKAESVINWSVAVGSDGRRYLSRVVVKGWEEKFDAQNEFHPLLVDTVRVHEIKDGFYQVRVFHAEAPTNAAPVVSGQRQAPSTTVKYIEQPTITNIMKAGERLTVIPAWPLNGSINPVEPILSPIVDKEISLYNKISRRNHLLYGAATYTPILSTDMTDEAFQDIVDGGLGVWIKLPSGSTATVLETPTAALQDMDRAIAAGIEEMAKMGLRMLTPEAAQSGVALEIRNAAQTAQLGTLNTKVSNTMRQIIVFMLNWRYHLDLSISDVDFNLSTDFTPTPLGADWLRLATEWYQSGLIPRSVWIQLLQLNDMLSPDYDDEAGKVEITQDADAVMAKTNENTKQLEEQA